MAITGISSYDGKQIIAAGAQSAISAGTASDLVWTAGISSKAGFFTGNQFASGGFYVASKDNTKDVEICPDYIQFYNSTYTPGPDQNIQITSGKIAKWDSLSSTKQDKLTFGYTDNQISQINGSAIYSQGGGGGYTGNVQQALDKVYTSSGTWDTVTAKLDAASQVVTATGGTTAYVQTINGKNISATNAGSAVSATNAYNLTNTAIKVASATSASTAYTLGNTAIKVASATSASNANTATYASNGVSLTNIYNSARSGYAASAYIAGKQIVNGRYKSYDSYNNPNWWTGNNIYGLKLNSASVFNSTGISVEGARVDGIEVGMNGSTNWILHINFLFSKFIPINTATWNTVTNSFISTNSGHFVAPVYSEMWTNWGAPFGAAMIDSDTLWSTNIKLNKFDPWTGYTGDKVFLNFTVPWVGG